LCAAAAAQVAINQPFENTQEKLSAMKNNSSI
jgi:hypothetical protein